MDLQQLRKEYSTRGIELTDLATDPIKQFQAWFDEAIKHLPGAWCEPNAVTLSTASRTGQVTSRTVLLKGISPAGFEFFTNYDSEKGQQLAENPVASLLFFWPWLDRQVRIEGSVSRTSRERSRAYFHSRPRGAQIGAAASMQSRRLASRAELDQRCRELASRLEGQPVPLPDFWGGFLLSPQRVEFWQGRLDRLHDRLVFDRDGEGWRTGRLSP